MARMFDKVSEGFLNAIKDVLEAKKTNKHGHDLPGEEDADIDNDGDTDKSDKYLHNRRKAIGKAMMKKEEANRIDEISTKLALDYMDKASDARGMKKLSTAKQDKRYASTSLAHKKIAGRGVTVPTNEEAEQVDELSKPTMGRYINRAKDSIDFAAYRQGAKGSTTGPLEKKLSKRHKGIETAVKKLTREEADQIDELSKKTLGSYTYQAASQLGSKGITTGLKIAADEPTEKNFKKMGNRQKGVATAVKKLTKEESDQIDELSNKTLGSYVKKAADSTRINTRWAARTGDREAEGIVDKRRKGINKAVDKLTKEEIEMIEAKLAGVADGSMEGDKHMCATKVFHKEWNEGTPIKTMHADPDAEGLIEWYDVMFDHGIERVMTEDMEVLQAESHMHSKKKMKEEVEELDENAKIVAHLTKRYGDNVRKSHVMSAAKDFGVDPSALAKAVRKKLGKTTLDEEQIDEARGRPKKAAAKDFTVHPITKKKLMHNDPKDMDTIEKLQKHGHLEKPKTEAGQHVINQLQKAKTSMQGGSTIHFTHGESKHVSGSHAAKLITKYQGMKPSEKEDFQKDISHSHERLMKHV